MNSMADRDDLFDDGDLDEKLDEVEQRVKELQDEDDDSNPLQR